MITNATLTARTAKGPAGRDGTETWGAEVPLAVRCAAGQPKFAQRQTIGATIADATAVLYVLRSALGNVALTAGDRIKARVDGSAERRYLVVHVVDQVKAGGLSHLEVFVKE